MPSVVPKLFIGTTMFLLLSTMCRPSSAQPNAKVTEEGLHLWLRSALDNYTDWVRENNLDPTPANPEPLRWVINSGDFFQLDLEIRNFYTQNYAENITLINGANGGIEHKILYLDFQQTSTQVIFGGHFKGNGIVNGTLIISGNGIWRVIFSDMRHIMEFKNFTITPDGYVNVSDVEGLYVGNLLAGAMPEIEFDGMFDNVDEVFMTGIKYAIRDSLLSLLGPRLNPDLAVFFRYFKELFEKTHIAQILTPPPCSKVDINDGKLMDDVVLSEEEINMLVNLHPVLKQRLGDSKSKRLILGLADN